MTSFEQFKESRTWCDDLGEALKNDLWAEEPKFPIGFVYLGTLYIEQVQDHWPQEAKARGRWHLRIGRDERISDDLIGLERELFEYAKCEGIIEPVAKPALSLDKVARAHAATLLAIWAAWSDEMEDSLDDALRLTCEAIRKLDLHQVDGTLASPLNYYVCAYLDETNPEDLTYDEMFGSIRISLSL